LMHESRPLHLISFRSRAVHLQRQGNTETVEEGEQLAGVGILEPLLKALEGKAVPRSEVVQASRLVAAALVTNGRPITLWGEVHGQVFGIWNDSPTMRLWRGDCGSQPG
jgi:hypothetical protein